MHTQFDVLMPVEFQKHVLWDYSILCIRKASLIMVVLCLSCCTMLRNQLVLLHNLDARQDCNLLLHISSQKICFGFQLDALLRKGP